MKWADRVRNSFLVDHDDCLGMNRDEILMWHANFFAARQLQRERVKAILQSAPDLLDNHGSNIPFPNLESILTIRADRI